MPAYHSRSGGHHCGWSDHGFRELVGLEEEDFISPLKKVSSGGPEIPFRGGRVDAVGPNTPGVPEPQDSLDSHIAAFARQGFTQTEMISLVACGCTFPSCQQSRRILQHP